MGTERSEVQRTRCFCGQGEFIIERCEVDHPWPTATPLWYEGTVACASCRTRFQMQQRCGRFVLVEQSAVAERDRRLGEAARARCALLGRPEVQRLLEQAILVLERERSVAAVQRLLQRHHLDGYSYSAFNKQWSGAADWVRKHTSPRYLERLCALAGYPIPDLHEWLTHLAGVEEQANAEAPQCGEAIFTVSED